MTEQAEPASPNVSTEPNTKHEPDDTAYDTAPEPEPPDVFSVRPTPYVPEVVLMVSGLCETRAIVRVPLFLVSEYRLALLPPYDTEGIIE